MIPAPVELSSGCRGGPGAAKRAMRAPLQRRTSASLRPGRRRTRWAFAGSGLAGSPLHAEPASAACLPAAGKRAEDPDRRSGDRLLSRPRQHQRSPLVVGSRSPAREPRNAAGRDAPRKTARDAPRKTVAGCPAQDGRRGRRPSRRGEHPLRSGFLSEAGMEMPGRRSRAQRQRAAEPRCPSRNV